jgi:enoyl-CoA hydratase/carnithine racemase
MGTIARPIDIRTEGPVLVITLNDPETRNSLQPEVYEQGHAALSALDTKTIGAVVLTGANGAFCSGGDLRRLKGGAKNGQEGASERPLQLDAFHRFIKALRACPVPVIAAVEGFAAGAGFSIAMACDLVIAAQDARFVMAYVKVGLNPDGGASAFLNRGLPHQIVSEMLFTGDPIQASRLAELGCVNRLCPPGTARDEALTLANRLAQGPRAALGRAKTLIEGAQHNSLDDQLDLEAKLFLEATQHPESAEGMAAFLEKRPANYSGL